MNPLFKTLVALATSTLISTLAIADTVTVAELHSKRGELSGKQITITGKVIKVNNGILRRNFIHVQDGTGSGDGDRAVFTSQEKRKVGDTVTATGTVKLDTDFGMGYFYPTLIEQATFTESK